MCGIAGFVDHSLTAGESEKIIGEMLASIAYRGPDATNQLIEQPFVLGHNRLSIIDLSESCTQPMQYGDFWIIFNGEIYNYIEVKNDLVNAGCTFSTQSDTEVILAAYQTFGADAVKRFIGMWSLAIYDRKKKELFCSRDRFGIKPFYYIYKGDKFYFGSEYKTLKKTPLFSNKLNLAQVSRGLQLGWVCYEDETYFEDIKSLPAACNLLYKDGKIKIDRYWNISLNNEYKGTDEEKLLTFRNLFIESVKLHMRSDVEVGGCLSGGLDSSAIASAVSVLFPESNFKTFTIYYEGKDSVDERPWVKKVLNKFPSLTNFEFSPGDDDIRNHLKDVVYHADVPIAGSSPISQYFVMKLAASHKIKVLLDGQGSDEYLAGYMHSFYRLIGGLIRKFHLAKAAKEFYKHAQMQNYTAVKTIDAFGKSMLAGIQDEDSLYQFEYRNYYPFLSVDRKTNFHLNGAAGSRLNEFLYHLTFTTSLPSLLHYEDRNSMAFSIESRVPFLDHRLVEFVFSLPDEDKFSRGNTKSILRRSLQGLVPDTILNRKDKKGFVTPGEIKWLRGPLSFLLDVNFDRIDFVSKHKSTKILEEFRKGDNSKANMVWRIAMLNYWVNENA